MIADSGERAAPVPPRDMRRTAFPQDFNELKDSRYGELKGCGVDQGEYRILCAVDEKSKTVKIWHILNGN